MDIAKDFAPTQKPSQASAVFFFSYLYELNGLEGRVSG